MLVIIAAPSTKLLLSIRYALQCIAMPGQIVQYCVDAIDITLSLLCVEILLDPTSSQQSRELLCRPALHRLDPACIAQLSAKQMMKGALHIR